MRRLLAVAVALAVALGLMAAPAQAQAPAPKVTINGLIDMVSAWTKNISMEDLNTSRRADTEWYSRTRLRPDIVAEVGTTKAVIGLEVDYIWGETVATTGTRFGFGPSQMSAGRLNLDQTNVFELKWGYLEFDLPVVPMATRVRLGGQPAAVTLKPGVYWGGDFAGVHITSTFTPMIRGNFTYGQIQERSFGHPRFTSGDDFALAVSLDITPFKGLDIRPLYSYLFAEGVTGGLTRIGRGGVANSAAFFGTPGGGGRAVEHRHTIGVDARWRSGPFSLAPTVFYQIGTREILVAGALEDQDMSAWYVDIRPGFTAGPLLLEGFLIYTTGNRARDELRTGSKIRYFQAINLDSGFYGGIADIWALNIDYLSAVQAPAQGIGFLNAIGYDKYGLINLGARATYSLTPALAFRGGVHARWTVEKVDTDGTIAAATGITPSAGASGDDRYLGTEVNVGLTYRFAPNVAFDLVGAHLFTGDAFASATATGLDGVTRPNTDPKGISKVAARVRYTF